MNGSRLPLRDWPVRHMLVAVVLFLVLGGPTPGNVGGCGEESITANAETFCIDRATLVCDRRWARGELDDAQLAQCKAPIETSCNGNNWPPECLPPTTRQTDACLAALSEVERLDEPAENFAECMFCGGDS